MTVDPETGNYVTTPEVVDYLVALSIENPNWEAQSGTDKTAYPCRGRLLYPSTLDPRITNGSQASATVNGLQGRFELVFDLAMRQAHRGDLRQEVQGLFRVIGGG